MPRFVLLRGDKKSSAGVLAKCFPFALHRRGIVGNRQSVLKQIQYHVREAMERVS